MEKGYVYIGRLVDHKGEFVTNYFKIGKSGDFKTREVNLNSTHLPIDVMFIRVFETNLLSNLEKILHACFDEYRVIKTYDWRRNITTEWFDVTDEDKLESKIDTVIKNFPNTKEIDLIQKISTESGTTTNEKSEMIQAVKKAKTLLKLFINDEEKTGTTAKETFKTALSFVASKVGWQRLASDGFYVTDDIEKWKESFTHNFSYDTIDGYYIYTGLGNETKHKLIQGMIKKYEIPELRSTYQYDV